MRYDITGSLLQTLTIALDPGEMIFSQAHAMAWMSDSIEMDTHTGGGMFAGLRRSLSGGSFFITDFTSSRTTGEVTFAPRFPGTILAMTLASGQSLVCRKETFLCAEKSVGLDIVFQQRLGAGLFAGEGFLLQQVTGPGTVFLDLSGEVVEKMLAPGERLRVQAGHIGIQDPTVDTDITLVNGFRNAVFGCEGFFLATLTGPGRVWLQSMPILNLAEEIGRHLPGRAAVDASVGAGIGRVVGGGAAGAAIGGLIGGILSSD